MKKYLNILLAAALLYGCSFHEDPYIDFTAGKLTKGMFQPTATRISDVEDAYPDDTTMPDGTSANEFIAAAQEEETKATGTSPANIMQNLLKWGNQSSILEISGTYPSHDDYGNDITLSGKVLIPKTGDIKRIILASHYTIGTNAEAPSNCFPLEGILAKLGYAVVMADYIGYGVTADHIHPYLMMDLTAHNVVDMYFAVAPFLEAIGRKPLNDDIYLMGYSQGGGTTMSVQYVLETEHGSSSKKPVTVRRNFAGGGIYDIKYTFESYVETNLASYPCGIPFVLVGQVYGNHLSESYLQSLLQPRIFEKTNDWFLTKKTTTGQMNEQIGTHVSSEILSEKALDRTNVEISTLYQLMTMNSVLSFAWEPEAPVYMMHSIDDETVPFANASRAKERWSNSNIQFNFGHYGKHQNCCLRFIYTVQTILKNESD